MEMIKQKLMHIYRRFGPVTKYLKITSCGLHFIGLSILLKDSITLTTVDKLHQYGA